MNITLDDMIQKHAACVAALDETKNCDSCRYKECAHDEKPCSSCYNELLGMPVNPTNWESINCKELDAMMERNKWPKWIMPNVTKEQTS